MTKSLEHGAGWILFVDDDHSFESDVLGRLLRHDVDIVVPVVLGKRPPHRWIAWESFDVPPDASDEQLISLYGEHPDPPRLKYGQTGLVELGCCGTGMVLIRAEVFETLSAPWFQFGRIGPDLPGEDTAFFLDARRAGFRIFCDTSTQIGHLTTVNVMPSMNLQRTELTHAYDFDFGNVMKQNARGATLQRV